MWPRLGSNTCRTSRARGHKQPDVSRGQSRCESDVCDLVHEAGCPGAGAMASWASARRAATVWRRRDGEGEPPIGGWRALTEGVSVVMDSWSRDAYRPARPCLGGGGSDGRTDVTPGNITLRNRDAFAAARPSMMCAGVKEGRGSVPHEKRGSTRVA
jgi:hypothetical protein